MIPPVPTPVIDVTEDCVRTTEKLEETGMKENRKIPITYEEVLLTEEAAEILEKAKKAAAPKAAKSVAKPAAPKAEKTKKTPAKKSEAK